MTYAQIVSLSCQIAKCPNFTSQASLLLNDLLGTLCRTQDFDIAMGTTVFNLSGAGGGAGPNNLPADYLRARKNEVLYTIDGVPYVMISIDLSEYDALVQTAGFQSFPVNFATNMSTTPPTMFVWPPANGAYPTTLRYQRLMPTVADPATDNTTPWFPDTTYLRQELTGQLCLITGDDRAAQFLSDNEDQHPMGSAVLLRKLLKLQGDPEGRAKTVTLDRRRFGPAFDRLENTKQIGW